ncbi:MAG: ATP synthase F1 subunit epsilon [Rhodospirillaceae bacterium]|jgi:F-type H+-transporting ATPase subunit epsilon|nr:ATP synthase F1 subunit epsilon [Rhodospirillaceae bacterium]MBT6136370.1 ATP synthase F1 subunit epsilon [Rhodospirillaceae bacterium]MBT7755539.1 ATP synthase F1 subunit epsilon [Candidatus Magasanikbacteria bacterium]
MADTTIFEMVSPEKLLISKEVGMVVVPGSEGNFGVLPRHTPMIATLRPGVIDIHEDGKVTDRIFVASGFAEVTETRCTVLAEEATALSDVTVADVEKSIADLQDDLKDTTDEFERGRIEARIDVQSVLLAALR